MITQIISPATAAPIYIASLGNLKPDEEPPSVVAPEGSIVVGETADVVVVPLLVLVLVPVYE